jgi:hypothetical protein
VDISVRRKRKRSGGSDEFARSVLASNAIAFAYLTQPLLLRLKSPT